MNKHQDNPDNHQEDQPTVQDRLDALLAEILRLTLYTTYVLLDGDLSTAGDIAAELAIKQGEMKAIIEEEYGPDDELDEKHRTLLKSVDRLLEMV
jgi:hypothetical protein